MSNCMSIVADLEDEVSDSLLEKVAENERSGMSPKQAQLAAVDAMLAELGESDPTQAQRSARYQSNFEVAPDPNDEALSSEWNALSLTSKQRISRAVAQAIVPKVLAQYKATGNIVEQIGSYMDDTNPSFALQTDSPFIDAISRMLGYVLRQDSMANFAAIPFPGSEQAQAVVLEIGNKTFDEVQGIYNTIRSKVPQVSGQSYTGKTMTILNVVDWTGIETDELMEKIDTALDGVYDIANKDFYYSFPEKKDYNYDNREEAQQGSGSRVAKDVQQASRDFRTEASAQIKREIAREKAGEVKHSIRGPIGGTQATVRKTGSLIYTDPRPSTPKELAKWKARIKGNGKGKVVSRRNISAFTQAGTANLLPTKIDTQKAEAAGFDTSTTYYHGTVAKDFKGFKVGNGGVDELGAGVYVTSRPEYAESWAGTPERGGRIIPVFLKRGDIFDMDSIRRSDKMTSVWMPLAKRLKAKNKVTAIEYKAKEIRDTKPVTQWTDEESRIVNSANAELWRSWLMVPDKDLAQYLSESQRNLNQWLSRAGYIGAKSDSSQIPGQVVVFEPKNLRSPWAKFNPKKAESTDLLHSKRDFIDTPAYKTWSGGLDLIESGEQHVGGPAVFVAYHGTTHSDIEKFNRVGVSEGFLGKGPYFTTDAEDASENYAGIGPDLTSRIEQEKENYLNADTDQQSEILQAYFDKNPGELPFYIKANKPDFDAESWDNDVDAIEELFNRFGDPASELAATEAVKGDTDGLMMKVYVKLENPADTTGNGQLLTYEVTENEDGDIESETGTLLDWIEAARSVGERLDVSGVDDYISSLQTGDEVSMKDAFDLARKHLNEAYDDMGEMISAGGIFAEIAEEAGYDGVIMDAGLHFGPGKRGFGGARVPGMKGVKDGTLHMVPFKATSVKSAIGNNGNYSLTDAHINHSIRQTDTPEFKKWFGDSKVVDADGKPLVVYHGGDKITTFDAGKIGKRDSGYYGYGFYFSPSKSSAAIYAGGFRDAPLPRGKAITDVYVSLQNPVILNSSDRDAGMFPKIWTDRQIAKGHDGVIVLSDNGDIFEVVSFYNNPTKIKSATGNRGTFDGADPDIRHSTRVINEEKDNDNFYTHLRRQLVRNGLEPIPDQALVSAFEGGKQISGAFQSDGSGDNRDGRVGPVNDMDEWSAWTNGGFTKTRRNGELVVRHVDAPLANYGAIIRWTDGPEFMPEYLTAGIGIKARGVRGFMWIAVPSNLVSENPTNVEMHQAYLDGNFASVIQTRPINDSEWWVGIHGPRIGSRAYEQLKDHVTVLDKFDSDGNQYTQLQAGPVVAMEWQREAVRRLAMKNGGALPDFVFDRATGSNPNRKGFLVSSRQAEVRYSMRDTELADPDIRHSRREIIGKTKRQYTPDQLAAFANVGFEVEVPSLKERAKELWKDAGKKLAQGIVDQFAPIKDLDLKAYGLMRLAKGASGAFETLLRGGKLKLTDGVYDFDETDKGGVVEKLLTPMQGEHHDFLRWVAANRAERLMGEDKEHLFSDADIAAIKTLKDGTLDFDYTIKNGANKGQVTRNRADMYKDSLITFNEFNKNVMDMAEESGLIDGAARQYWEHEFYVPFYRMSDEDGFVGAKIKGGVVRQQAFKALKGGKDKLNTDLLDNTLMNWAHLLDASAKNRAAKASLEAAESVGVALSTDETTARQIGKATGNKNGVVWFMDGGKEHFFVVDDPFVLTAITALEYAGMRNPAMNALGTMKHMLTVGVTASPFFKVRNLIRDSIQVIGTGPIDYNPIKNVVDGWKLSDPKNDMYFRLLAGGGTIHFGTMLEGTEAKRVQALVESGVHESTILGDEHKIKAFYRKRIEPLITAYNELGNRGETVNRASLYDQLVKQGMSHAEASLQARDLMDFSMQGAWTGVRFLTQIVPFLNARLQGMYKLGRAAKEDPRRMAYVAGAVALASLGLLAAYGDDDDWKKREAWDRDNYWWFKIGGTAFRIPKPFEIGAIGTLAERSAELIFTKEMTGSKFNESVLKLLGDNLSMNPVPQLIKPMIDIYSNKDSFSGRPIESMSMERMKADYRFTGNTSMAARAVSTGANAITGLVGKETLSPVQIDHLIKGYFGWLGMFVTGFVDIPARYATSQPDRPMPDLWKMASGGMVSQLQDAPSKYVSAVYDQAKAIDEAYGTWQSLLKDGKLQEAKEFRDDNIEKLKVRGNVQAIKGALTKINQRIREVENSDMDRNAKREAIRQLNVRKDQFARRLAPQVG